MRRMTKKRVYTLAGLAGILAVCAVIGVFLWRAAAGREKKQEISVKRKVVCVGDSITYGAGVGKNRDWQSYPAYLQRFLGDGYEVINYGISGRMLLDYGKYPYVDEDYYQISLDEKADIYILMLGTNDSKIPAWNAEVYEAQLEKFIQSYREANEEAEIYVMQPPKCFPDLTTGIVGYSIKNEIIETEIYDSIAEAGENCDAVVIDLYHLTEDHNDWFVDGVHPNAEGNWNIAFYISQRMEEEW